MTPAPTIEAILRGEIGAAARLMRDLDDEIPGARDRLRLLFPHTGRAHVIGVTGPPGVGKSSLVDQLIAAYRRRCETVGVVAVDPSSPFGGGAILGDRIRMQRHATDPGVFVRSVATRGHLGGLSRSTCDIVDVMDAAGKDVIIIETVGVGQDEIDIMRTAHTTVVVQVPGLGDDIQAIKAGILEIANIFVVNKADLDGTDAVVRDLASMLGTSNWRDSALRPEIVKTQATRGNGIADLLAAIDRHGRHLRDGDWPKLQRQRLERRFLEQVREQLYQYARHRLASNASCAEILSALGARSIDPYTAAGQAVAAILAASGTDNAQR